MFWSFAYSGGQGSELFFARNIKIKDSKVLYLEPKHTFKEIEMVRNKHHEDFTDGLEGDNIDLEAMISSFGLQEGLNQRSCKAKPLYGISLKWTFSSTV